MYVFWQKRQKMLCLLCVGEMGKSWFIGRRTSGLPRDGRAGDFLWEKQTKGNATSSCSSSTTGVATRSFVNIQMACIRRKKKKKHHVQEEIEIIFFYYLFDNLKKKSTTVSCHKKTKNNFSVGKFSRET